MNYLFKSENGANRFDSKWLWKSNWDEVNKRGTTLAEKIGNMYGAGEYLLFEEGKPVREIHIRESRTFVEEGAEELVEVAE